MMKKEEAKSKKELSKEPEVLKEAIEDEEFVNASLERAKDIDQMKRFSESMEARKHKVSLVAEPRWLSKTLGRGLGNMLGNLAVPQPSSCRECVMMTTEIKDHDKVMQDKNE